jgi:hypothetical protein
VPDYPASACSRAIEYQNFTWHTQLDTYERIVPEDVKQAATEIASMVWTVANLDKMIPGSPKNKCRYHPAAAAANDVWAELG